MSVQLSPELELEVDRIRQIENDNRDVVESFRWFDNRDSDLDDLCFLKIDTN